MSVLTERHGRILVVKIDRPLRRNAVDGETAILLHQAFLDFDASEEADVAVLTGSGEHFCAGADLKAFGEGDRECIKDDGSLAPMGPSRLVLSKPVIAAIEGFAVAGGLELALWCDLRVVSETAVFGVFCRRLGVPLIDLGTIRLPRLIGHSRAMDMILTGREVMAEEAEHIGLANRLVGKGYAFEAALELAESLVALPQVCMRNDRLSAIEQWGMGYSDALANEMRKGLATIDSGETLSGAKQFSEGHGRHGKALEEKN